MLELVIHSSCRPLLLCMWRLWKQMKQQSKDKPGKSCWHIVCFTKVQILHSRMQQQSSLRQTKMLSYVSFSTSQERRWILPTLASSQTSFTGGLSINQPSLERVNPHYKTSLTQNCKFKMLFAEIDWQVLSPKELTAVCTPLSYRDPFKSSSLFRNKKLPVASIQ